MLKFLYTYELHWPAWKFGFLKISMLCLGIIIGSLFPTFWQPYHAALWGVFGITAVITAFWGFQAMAAASQSKSLASKTQPHNSK